MLPQNESGLSAPLTLACARGHVETARILLEYGAYVDHQNKVFGLYFMYLNEAAQ